MQWIIHVWLRMHVDFAQRLCTASVLLRALEFAGTVEELVLIHEFCKLIDRAVMLGQ